MRIDLTVGLPAVTGHAGADPDQAEDWLKTRSELTGRAEQSDRFMPYQNGNGKSERYPTFRIVSPACMYDEGISIDDLYLPIEYRMREE